MRPSLVEITPSATKIDCTITVPGSKSYTNRALIIAAQANGQTVLKSASCSDDSQAVCQALQELGVRIELDRDQVKIIGRAGEFIPFQGVIDVGPAGTAMRFLTALISAIPGSRVDLIGTERMHQRPIADLVSALRQLGAEIQYIGQTGYPPLRIFGQHLSAAKVSLKADISSQYLTALMLISPLLSGELEVELIGNPVSQSYVAMTLETLKAFGLQVQESEARFFRIDCSQRFQPGVYQVDGDASGASYLWAIAALTKGHVRIDNLRLASSQGDLYFPQLLKQMGCHVQAHSNSISTAISVTGTDKLKAISADMSLMPDTAQTLAVVAACAEGRSTISGLSTLKHKETDRLAALVCELSKLGIKAVDSGDQLLIEGGKPKPALLETYGDHRMAMAFATLGSRIPGLSLRDPLVVEKSFPNFWEVLEQMGIGVVLR